MSNIDLYDTVKVVFEDLDISEEAQVVETEWDVLRERYTSVQIGSPRKSLSSTIAEAETLILERPTETNVQSAIDRATGVLNAGTRGHAIFNRNSEGWANELLFLDNATIASAENVLRLNNSGIGFSSTGYAGPYYQAWTIDGHLSLGGVNNSYGHLSILDSSGNEIGSWSVDGIVIDEGSISIARGSDVGLEVDPATGVFRFGDFEVSTAYGRQILQSSDEKTGMSGEPNESGKLYLWAGYVDSSDYVLAVNNNAEVRILGDLYVNGENILDAIHDLQDASSSGPGGSTEGSDSGPGV